MHPWSRCRGVGLSPPSSAFLRQRGTLASTACFRLPPEAWRNANSAHVHIVQQDLALANAEADRVLRAQIIGSAPQNPLI